MATIIWSTALETGHRQIDLQHQELVDLINELTEAFDANCADTVLLEILPRLASYVLFHFSTEETLMTQLPANNEHSAIHRRQHDEFTTRVNALRAQIAAGERPPAAPLAEFLKNWLSWHIMQTDRELVALLNLHKLNTPH